MSPRRSTRPSSRVPQGERYYVVGDIHGRLDLLEKLAAAIEDDAANHAADVTTVVLLGDLVDRGPASAGVIDFVRRWKSERPLRCLAGNHEEMFLESFHDIEMLRHFLRHGGRDTVLSYDIDFARYNSLSLEELQTELHTIVPPEHRAFLSTLENYIVAGDYLFVHAGIAPDVPLEEQKVSDMRWIRDRFLRHASPFSHVVVHGHTIFDTVANLDHRIGVDTGAFRTGRLTALVLEDDERHTIQAVENDGSIGIERSRLA